MKLLFARQLTAQITDKKNSAVQSTDKERTEKIVQWYTVGLLTEFRFGSEAGAASVPADPQRSTDRRHTAQHRM
jgi:hypothetical protein